MQSHPLRQHGSTPWQGESLRQRRRNGRCIHDLANAGEETPVPPGAQQGPSDSEDRNREAPSESPDPESAYDLGRVRTLHLLTHLNTRDDGHYDASPLGLAKLPTEERLAAFSPPPTVPPVTDILFDAWALTSVRERMPGRPPVANWLHGLAGWEPPETQVAWREEVGLLRGDLLTHVSAADLLADYPLKPHEVLRDITKRVGAELKNLAKKPARRSLPIWLRSEDGNVAVHTLGDMAEGKAGSLDGLTILLPQRSAGSGTVPSTAGPISMRTPRTATMSPTNGRMTTAKTAGSGSGTTSPNHRACVKSASSTAIRKPRMPPRMRPKGLDVGGGGTPNRGQRTTMDRRQPNSGKSCFRTSA